MAGYDLGFIRENEVAEMPKQIHRMAIRERLENSKKALEQKVKDIDLALQYLDKVPDYEQSHDAISRVGF